MKNLFIMTALVAGLALGSCNKDQKVVKELEGSWKSTFVNGVAVPDTSAITLEFINCKLKQNSSCDVVTTFPDGSTNTQEYLVEDDGTKLVFLIEELGFQFKLSNTIDELTETKLVLTATFDTISTTTEYAKL